jgi:mannose-6-phosphate isomerase-like protein (cupin superfamily)
MRRALFPVAALAVTLLVAPAPGAQKSPPVVPTSKPMAAHPAAHKVLHDADIVWTDAPPNLTPGAKLAVLDGDPSKSGLYTMRLKIPNGYHIAPHWHPMAEHLTVISGTFHVATGDKFEASKGAALKPGEFVTMPAKLHH